MSAPRPDDIRNEDERLADYHDALARGLSDAEAREEGWPTTLRPEALTTEEERECRADHHHPGPDAGYECESGVDPCRIARLLATLDAARAAHHDRNSHPKETCPYPDAHSMTDPLVHIWPASWPHPEALTAALDGIRDEVRDAVLEGDAQDCSSADCIADAVYEIVRVRLLATLDAARTPAPDLHAAAQKLLDAALDSGFPDDEIDAESSYAQSITVRGRDLAALRAALRSDTPEPTLDAAWKAVEAALPEGWLMLIGQEDDGWWATASEPHDPKTGHYRIVSTTANRRLADSTPAEALLALAARLSDGGGE